MSWKKWKRGLLIAMLTGAGTGMVGLAAGVTWRQAFIIMAVSLGKDLVLYLQQHPVETISDTTQFLNKGQSYGAGSVRNPDFLPTTGGRNE